MAPPRPPGYRPPPPPRAGDVARTLRTIVTGLVPAMARMARHAPGVIPSTSTAEGLALVQASFAEMLRDLGVDLEVLHVERLPREGGLVMMWNQESHLDHLVLATAIPRPFFSLFNNAVARVPFYGAHMRATGHVHIDRGDEGQWRAGVAEAAERVKQGECVLVSPEGTRSWDAALLPMKRGALQLAIASERPVVCVTVVGGHARMPRGSAFARRGPLRVVFSEPFEPGRDEQALGAALTATFERLKREFALRSPA